MNTTQKKKPLVSMPLTMLDRLIVQPAKVEDLPPASQSEAIKPPGPIPLRSNGATNLVAPITLEPADVTVLPKQIVLSVGVTLLIGSTAAGKSVVCAALAACGSKTGIPSCYFSTFEPRSPLYQKVKDVRQTAKLRSDALRQAREREAVGGKPTLVDVTKLVATRRLFTDTSQFVDDVDFALREAPDKQPGLAIFDSATDAIKGYAADPAYENQTTYPKGMQPSDRGFLNALKDVAYSKRYAIIIVLSSVLIPYAEDLYGGTEGLMKISNLKNVSISDRSERSGRTGKTVVLPDWALDQATRQLGLGAYDPKRASSQTRAIGGFGPQ